VERSRTTEFQEKRAREERRVLKLGCHGSPSPRRLTHPTSGRSPDSRFSGLAAFPTATPSPGLQATPMRSVAFGPALHDHSGGAVPDFHRASLLSFQKAPEANSFLVTLNF
jgi:hypothetical protein